MVPMDSNDHDEDECVGLSQLLKPIQPEDISITMSNRSCGISACIGDDDNLQCQVISNFSSRDFANTLKEIQETTYGAGLNKRTGGVVTGFDTLRFTKFCDKSSPSYKAHYCNYDELVAELFQPNELWISQDPLLEAMEMLAKYHGFAVCCEKEFIKCNRQGKDKSNREYLNGPLNFGRTFQFKLSSLETEKYLPSGSETKNSSETKKKR